MDRDTGQVKILKYIAVDDCGKQVNPLLVEGQVQGGIAQSIGAALMEKTVYDENGQLLTGEFMDYAIPRATDIPDFVLGSTETPSPSNPLGVKGVGEAGTIGATPAIANAVIDALSPFGIRHLDLPFTPERVWRAIQDNGGRIMISAAFDYVRPATLDEALGLLAKYGEDAKVLAGGHSLIPAMKLRLSQPKIVVDIGRIGDLRLDRASGTGRSLSARSPPIMKSSRPIFSSAPARSFPRLQGKSATSKCATKGRSAGAASMRTPQATGLRRCWPLTPSSRFQARAEAGLWLARISS